MITLTPTAERKLTDILASQITNNGQVRISAVRGPHGCIHGWRLGIEHHHRPEDVVYGVGDLEIVIETELTQSLSGATIDYREDSAAIGFTIDAPQSRHQHGNGGCNHEAGDHSEHNE